MAHIDPNFRAHYQGGGCFTINESDGKRAKVTARPCWVCGNDARGKYCPPCSADVEQERNRWISRQRRKNK